MAVATDEFLVIFEPAQDQRALELLLWQDQGRPNLEALVVSLAKGAQLAEDTSFAVIAGTLLDAAEGVTLDRYGEIVGTFRGALSPEQFRVFLGLQIEVNTTFPSEDNMFSVLARAVDPSVVTSYTVGDGIIFNVTSDSFLPGPIVAHVGALIRDYRQAGVYAAVTEATALNRMEIGSIAEPGTATIGSIATPGHNVIGRLIYDGRSR